jgi:hypothetical protein
MDDNPPEQEVNAEFDPDRCALLHNELLSRAVGHIPGAAENMQQNCIQIALGNPPGWADTDALQKDDIVRFFSQLNVYDPRHAPFTGEFRQPDAVAFWNRTYGDMNDPDIILLYPTAFDIQQDAGLFLDLFTKRVTYGNMECGSLPASHSESWVPLEFALLKLLEMWDRGKYYWMDDSRSSILIRGFTPRDLEETLSAWEGLLEAIQTRLGDPGEENYRDPLPTSMVNQFRISPFAKAFLQRAKRPSFTFVGPGITVFTDERFEATMSSELPDSERSQFIQRFPDEPDLYPSLILPLADESVRLQTPFTIRERHLESSRFHSFPDSTRQLTTSSRTLFSLSQPRQLIEIWFITFKDHGASVGRRGSQKYSRFGLAMLLMEYGRSVLTGFQLIMGGSPTQRLKYIVSYTLWKTLCRGAE